MDNSQSGIPRYREINDFLASIPSDYRTEDPLFYCLRLKANEGSISNYKAPFKKDFYFIGLANNVGGTRITYDSTSVTDLNAFLVFQSPGLIYSFYRDPSANGYLLYFKKECFAFFKPDFENEFPYFNFLRSNFFKLNHEKYQEFAPHFEDVFQAYEKASDKQHRVAVIKLLALLYQLKEYTNAFVQWEESFSSPQQQLLQKFSQLVNLYYTEKRSIEEYAQLLNVTPNHLSQSVKAVSGKNALTFINDRLLSEARSLIRYTNYNMAEVAYRLNFSDPANFGKFFKKHSGMTPLEYRKENGQKN